MNDEAQRATDQAKAQADADRQFQQWMDRSETKVLLSLIKPIESTPEVAVALIRSAFEAGRTCGQAEVVGKLFESLMRPLKGRGGEHGN